MLALIALLVGLPLLARAQAPPASAPAAMDSAMKAAAPAKPAMPAAMDSAMKAAAPAKPAMPAALSDSARAAVKAQVEKELKAMADTLKLTPAQRSKARPIMLEHAYQVRELRTKYAAAPRTPETREAMAKDMQSLREGTDAKLAEVMSAEQMSKYKEMRDAMMNRVRARMSAADSSGGAKK
jgi:2-oxoglutarate dehydrogenase E1 component